MVVLIVTVGQKREPIYETIKQTDKIKKIFYLATEETKENAESLKKEFKNLYDSEMVVVEPDSFYDIISVAADIVKHQKEEVVFNITGGTKTMSLACYSLAAINDNKCFYIYYYKGMMKKIELPIINIPNIEAVKKNKRKYQILEFLSSENKSLSDISSKLNLKKPTIFGHLEKLEKMKLIGKSGRQKNLKFHITESGKILLRL